MQAEAPAARDGWPHKHITSTSNGTRTRHSLSITGLEQLGFREGQSQIRRVACRRVKKCAFEVNDHMHLNRPRCHYELFCCLSFTRSLCSTILLSQVWKMSVLKNGSLQIVEGSRLAACHCCHSTGSAVRLFSKDFDQRLPKLKFMFEFTMALCP